MMILLDRSCGALGAYCQADTSPKVGFRPYYLTDPHGAAMLSGLGQGSNPFKPEAWRLRGMGQIRPLDPWYLYPDNPIQRLSGMGYLGDAPDPMVLQAAEELYLAGHITDEQFNSIQDGSASLEDVVGVDPTDQSSWMDIVGLFREVNQELIQVEQDYAQHLPEHQGDAAYGALGRELIDKRNQYQNLATEFIHKYTLVVGSPPSGLSGLGFVPIVAWVAGAAIFLVTAVAVLYGLRDWSKSIDVKKMQAQTTQTEADINASLMQELQKALARGDTITAQTIMETLRARGVTVPTGGGAAGQDVTGWLMKNAKWIGLGVGGLIVLGPVTESLFGKRRR